MFVKGVTKNPELLNPVKKTKDEVFLDLREEFENNAAKVKAERQTDK